MITFNNGVWSDGANKRIRTTSELYQDAISKDNQRVSKEWDALGHVSGDDPAAVQLAAMQGSRAMKLATKHGYDQSHT